MGRDKRASISKIITGTGRVCCNGVFGGAPRFFYAAVLLYVRCYVVSLQPAAGRGLH